MSKQFLKLASVVVLAGLMTTAFGCSSKAISIRPMDYDYAMLNDKINGTCGLCVSEQDMKKQVVEGGLDSRYAYVPYKDLRHGMGYALKLSCSGLRFYDDKRKAMADGAQVIFVPKAQTKSTNSFPWWPPEDFTFDLDTDVFDGRGVLIQHVQSTGRGKAGRSQWHASDGYAGSKAMEKALNGLFRKLDYKKINAGLSMDRAAAVVAESQERQLPKTGTITQVVQLYQGVLSFPPPMWVDDVGQLQNARFYREQKKDRLFLEQIPKDQEFESWKELYGVYGFHLPGYDMKRFIDESLNHLASTCAVQAKSKIVSQKDGETILTYFCSELKKEAVTGGDDTESGFLYFGQVDQSFAKVYMAWRAPSAYMKTDKWPMNKALVTKALERLQKIRYIKAE